MEGDPTGAAQIAAAREATKHGCCCSRCSVRAEMWVCFSIDIVNIVALIIEIPTWYPVPPELHAVDMLKVYCIFSAISASIFLFALLSGSSSGWPRRVLARFLTLKIPIFLLLCQGYFMISPWAAPLARWCCEANFQESRTVIGGGSEETCVQLFPFLCYGPNSIVYCIIYGYTLKAAYEWFMCHPDNDGKGIWFSRRTLAHESNYAALP